jgi:hypothetical protein
MKNTFHFTSKNQLFFVVTTLAKGTYYDLPIKIDLPAIPSAGIKGFTYETTFSGTLSQKHYIGFHVRLAPDHWRLFTASPVSLVPRSFRTHGEVMARNYLLDAAVAGARNELSQERQAEYDKVKESATTSTVHAVTAALRESGLLPGITEDKVSFAIRYINLAGVDATGLVYAVIDHLGRQEAVNLAARYVLAKADRRDVEALTKVSGSLRDVEPKAVTDDDLGPAHAAAIAVLGSVIAPAPQAVAV